MLLEKHKLVKRLLYKESQCKQNSYPDMMSQMTEIAQE